MIFYFLAFLLIFVLRSKIFVKSFNEGYLSKENTTIVNGLFVILVFFSHFNSYARFDKSIDIIFYSFIGKIGQLMVTTFLFFSGYGIFESIKRKENYIKNFFKKRFIPTYLNFAFAVCVYLILNFILNSQYGIKQILLSFIGWEAIGNSNWYMFSIFILYIFTIFSFKIFKDNKKSIYLLTIITIVYIVLISLAKESWWYNTLLCYPFGLIYSFNKERIDKFILNNRHWGICFILNFVGFVALYLINGRFIKSSYVYNIESIMFVLTITLAMMKVGFKSKIFNYFGKNLFWIYIMQRIPMILLTSKISNQYVLFATCFTVTIIIAFICAKLIEKVYSFKKEKQN